MIMKMKLKRIRSFYKKGVLILFFLSIFILAPSFLLSGCAKTAYPTPPIVVPPSPVKVISIKKQLNSIMIVYKYKYTLNNIKAFLIYKKRFTNKKKINFSCSQSKLIAIQNLMFINKFRLKHHIFYYKANKTQLKTGNYYIFCIKSEDNFGIKSTFSNFMPFHVN